MKNELYKEIRKMKSNDLICVASRPGQGKTTTLLALAADLLTNNKNIVFVTLESSAELLKSKIKIKNNKKLNVVDLPNSSIEELSDVIEKIKKKTNVDYVFVDYIQLLNCDVKARDALLKELTISLNIPFVVSSQLPRNYNEMNIGLEKQEYTKIFIIKDFNEYEIL